MFERADVTYLYDSSFAGFLSCVFESYRRRETPSAIYCDDSKISTLFETRLIETNLEQAKRVRRALVPQMGEDAAELLRSTFLTVLPQKELHMLSFLQLGFSKGPSVMQMLPHPTVYLLLKAVQDLKNEAHKYLGFVRFTLHSDLMVATIKPKNNVLPYVADHFRRRFPREKFLIYDKTNRLAVLYQNKKLNYSYEEKFILPQLSLEEKNYQELWQLFHETISISERYNPTCQRNFMPKRYWDELTEMQPLLKEKKRLSASQNQILPAGKS